MNITFKLLSKIYLAFILTVIILLIGVFGFVLIEDYTLIEAIYMTVITVSTVGFNEVNQLSNSGRIFTIFLIITSFGIFAYSVSIITTYIVGGDLKNYIKKHKLNSKLNKIDNHVIVCGYGRNGKQAVKKLNNLLN